MLKFAFISFSAILLTLSCNIKSENHGNLWSNKVRDSSDHNKYSWLLKNNPSDGLVNRILVPEGYKRISLKKGSFGDWLRHLPLKEKGSDVKLFNGSLKSRQDVHYAVINIDAGGDEDLQQCADACMRLKAEYHYSKGEYSKIHFKFTSGDVAYWQKWKVGYRPVIKGNKVSWSKTDKPDSTYKNFKSYMKMVFRYAGTHSLSGELKAIQKENIQPGDLFINGGFPGHAVIVMDVAEHITTKKKIFLIAQSYMPAQEIHILKNFNDSELTPWYTTDFIEELNTPEWTFSGQCLKRFP